MRDSQLWYVYTGIFKKKQVHVVLHLQENDIRKIRSENVVKCKLSFPRSSRRSINLRNKVTTGPTRFLSRIVSTIKYLGMKYWKGGVRFTACLLFLWPLLILTTLTFYHFITTGCFRKKNVWKSDKSWEPGMSESFNVHAEQLRFSWNI